MSYVSRVLQPNEQLIAIGRLHWIIYGPAMFLVSLSLFVFVLGIGVADYRGTFGVVALLFLFTSAVLAIKAWFDQWITEIAVTNMRIIYKTGFIRRRTSEMNMSKVESVTVDQSIFGRLLGYGTVHIRGTGEGIEHLHRIAGPIELRNAIIAR